MPFPHERRRGATVLFRRKIPADLRDRFGCGEIVRSLGRVTPGEARRITHHLWSQTEVAFMFVRREPGLTRDEIATIVDVTVSDFRDQVDLAIANVRPNATMGWLDEPAQVAAGLRASAAALDSTLARNDMAAMTDRAQACSKLILGRQLDSDGIDVRRLARAITSAMRDEIRDASMAFAGLAEERPALARHFIHDTAVFDCAPEDLALLRSAGPGDNLTHVLARLRPAVDDEAAASKQPSAQDATTAAAPTLRNAHMTISELWPVFCANKVAIQEWKPNEVIAARTTLNSGCRSWVISNRANTPLAMCLYCTRFFVNCQASTIIKRTSARSTSGRVFSE